jgi:hypothetical protein
MRDKNSWEEAERGIDMMVYSRAKEPGEGPEEVKWAEHFLGFRRKMPRAEGREREGGRNGRREAGEGREKGREEVRNHSKPY